MKLRYDGLNPHLCAKLIAEAAEESTPEEWTTEEIAEFWHRLTEHCTLRLIKYKPEIVQQWPPR